MEWSITFFDAGVKADFLIFDIEIINENRRLCLKKCAANLKCGKIRQSVIDFTDRNAIISANNNGETIRRKVQFENILLNYTIDPHYDPVRVEVVSSFGRIELETANAKTFWAFFDNFCKLFIDYKIF